MRGVDVSMTLLTTYRALSPNHLQVSRSDQGFATHQEANGMADEIKCDECGINIAFYYTGGVYSCAPCELKKLGIRPTYIPYKKRPYERRKPN